MELLVGVIEFVALVVASRRWLFWLLVAVIVAGMVAVLGNLIEPGF